MTHATDQQKLATQNLLRCSCVRVQASRPSSGRPAMGWLQSILGKSNKLPDSEQVLIEAIELVKQGQSVEALTMMKQCVDTIHKASGDKSLPYAAALYHLGTLTCAAGDYGRGAGLCQQAADACPATKEGTKE